MNEYLQKTSKTLDVKLFNIGDTPVTLATLVTMLLVVVAAWLLSWLLQSAVRRGLRRRGVSSEGGAGAVTRLMHYVIVISGIAVALQTAGIELGALFAAGAVFAVGLGFAMQNIAQNFVSGVILLVERTIKPGDIVEVDGTLVRVQQMGIRATLARSLDEEELIVPNSQLVSSTVKNFTLKDSLYRVRVKVGVVYSSDMRQVRAILEKTAHDLDFREKMPEPRVLLDDFGDSSVNFEVSVWTSDPWSCRVAASKVREAIWFAFADAGITIAFPQLDVHFDPPVTQALGGLAKRAA